MSNQWIVYLVLVFKNNSLYCAIKYKTVEFLKWFLCAYIRH